MNSILSLSKNHKCSTCYSEGMLIFYEVKNVPVHSVLLMATREVSLNYPRGDIALGFCRSCGFISNVLFDPSRHEYSDNYEETQGFSVTFSRFHLNLADGLINRYDLYDKDIIEIGCGKGDFLKLLCERGQNRGIGFDPAYVSGRSQAETGSRTSFIRDFFSEKYAGTPADFICCKMTLEHIQNTAGFVKIIRNTIADRPGTILFFQVPDVARILSESAFWDIYYEHCSYYSSVALTSLFKTSGFDIVEIWREYGDQYLMIVVRPENCQDAPYQGLENELENVARAVEIFSNSSKNKRHSWQLKLKDFQKQEQRVVLWGGGSKGVAFLTTLGVRDEIEYVVDINPFRQGTYMAGTGQMIVAPEFLKEYQPDVVIVMNPVYRQDILEDLNRMRLTTNCITV